MRLKGVLWKTGCKLDLLSGNMPVNPAYKLEVSLGLYGTTDKQKDIVSKERKSGFSHFHPLTCGL